MKKLLFASILSIISVAVFSLSRESKLIKRNKVTQSVKEQFSQEFESAKNVYWTVSGDYQKAKFSIGEKRITAIYDLQGNYLGAVQYISLNELPESAKKEIAKSYKDFKFSEAVLVVGRPEGYSVDDVGSYWIDLSKKGEKIYVNYSYSKGLASYQTIEPIQIAQN